MEPPEWLDELATEVYYTARSVRAALGPGLYESVYERLLVHRLRLAGHDVGCQVPVHVEHEGLDLGLAGRIDVVVDHVLALELKATAQPRPIHEAQLLTYLRLARLPLGLLINFHAIPFRSGVLRRVNSAALHDPQGAPLPRGVVGVRGGDGVPHDERQSPTT